MVHPEMIQTSAGHTEVEGSSTEGADISHRLSLLQQRTVDFVYLILSQACPGKYNFFPLCVETINYFQLYQKKV